MDYLDSLTEERIDSETSDLVDQLLAQYTPSLAPCRAQPVHVLERLQSAYPLRVLPPDSIHCARTALSAVETCFPDDADYLPADPDDRLREAARLVRPLHLDVRCVEIEDAGAGHALYEQQKTQFEQRAAAFGLTWTPKPVRVCMECRTGYRLVTGSDLLADQITLWYGVSQDDIDRRTPDLIAYLRAKHTLENA